jgi:hypothetical protein
VLLDAILITKLVNCYPKQVQSVDEDDNGWLKGVHMPPFLSYSLQMRRSRVHVGQFVHPRRRAERQLVRGRVIAMPLLLNGTAVLVAPSPSFHPIFGDCPFESSADGLCQVAKCITKSFSWVGLLSMGSSETTSIPIINACSV